VAEGLVEIGFRLTEAKELVGHGNWLLWLERNFRWTERTAQRYMSVYELVAKYDIMSDLDLPMTTLVQLAAPSTPPEAIETVAERTEAGEKLTGADVKDIIDEAKSSSDTKPSKSSGSPVTAKGNSPASGDAPLSDPPAVDPPSPPKKKRRAEDERPVEKRIENAAIDLEDFYKRYSDLPLFFDLSSGIEKKLTAMKRSSPEPVASLCLQEGVKVLSDLFGYDAVSNAVLEHNP
jgi:hypothetical protein